MTGIDRLREMANVYVENSWSVAGKSRGRILRSIADQIERERACDEDAIENVRLIVGGVIYDMERHVSGVEGAEDSPVAHWARELRGALKSYTSDGSDGEKPSCADPDGAADVTSEAQKVTRDPAEDVSMSAYDLLPADEREAIAWVRDHGGLESVKKLLDWVVGHCSTEQQLDFDFWLSGRVMYELGFEEDMADRDEVKRRLLARLMPEGMEWLVEAWPRFEDGEPVGFGDEVGRLGEVFSISLYRDGSFALNFRAYSKGERVRRPAKVLDADGAEICVGDAVYALCDGTKHVVEGIEGRNIKAEGMTYLVADKITHCAPVLAADGLPLREGETVWDKDAEADTPLTVVEVSSDLVRCEYTWKDGKTYRPCYPPDQLTHERPDSWERIEEDSTLSPEVYCHRNGIDISQKDGTEIFLADTVEPMARDLVRRAKALAERERGE